MTYDPIQNRYVIVTYPSNNATVYALDGKTMQLVQSWTTAAESFFDYQFSPDQRTFYGTHYCLLIFTHAARHIMIFCLCWV
jgi:hypothetical protein